jgi:hypothetical protein
MPSITAAPTAERLKDRIVESGRMVVVASMAGKNSRWVPWELGFADGKLGPQNIAVLPVAEDNGKWQGSEYLGLYSEIKKTTTDVWAVFPNGQTTGGNLLRSWLLMGV